MRPLIAGLPLLLAACAVGPRPATFEPAKGPAGIRTTVDTTRLAKPVVGELLTVDVDGMRLLSRDDTLGWRLFYIARPRVVQASFAQRESTTDAGRLANPKTVTALRPLTRFPQGLDAERTGRLLAAYGIAAVQEVR